MKQGAAMAYEGSDRLPHSAESERAILGAIILENSLMASAIEQLKPGDFFLLSNQRIFRAMVVLFERGVRLEPVLIGVELQKDKHLETSGGVSYITDLTFGLPRSKSLSPYVEKLKEDAARRQVMRTAAAAIERAGDPSKPLAETVEQVRRDLDVVCWNGNGPPSFEEVVAPWPELDDNARYGLAGEFVRLVEPHSESDPVALLIQFLVMYGNAIGRSAYFPVEADRHYMNLFAVVVGATSSGRKGTSHKQAWRRFEAVDAEWAKQCLASGLSSGEGLIYAVRDEIRKDQPVKIKGRATGESESVVVDSGATDKRLFISESEFASVLQTQGREGNILSAVIRQAWDSGDLRTLVKNSPLRSTDAHISIVGQITNFELKRLLDDTESANGYVNRFLWLSVRRSKYLPEGGRVQEENWAPFTQQLRESIEFGSSAGEMCRDDEARELWRQEYPRLADGCAGLFGAITARAAAQVLRLSCVYALLDSSTVVRRQHLEAGLGLWNYCQDSARLIFGTRTGDKLADEILRALREAARVGMTSTELNDHFHRNQTSQAIGAALLLLAESGQVRSEEDRTGKAGRPTKRWFCSLRTNEKNELIN